MPARTIALALVTLLFSSCDASGASEGSAFDRASRAAAQGVFRDAKELFAVAARTETDPERRERARIRLANIEWRVFREHAAARARLQPVATAPAHTELARLAADLQAFATARAEAKKALAVATKKSERRRATVALAQGVLGDPRSTDAELREVIDSLRGIIAAEGPWVEPSRLLTRAALRAGDGAAALEGINGYYHVSAYSGPPHPIAEGHATLAKILPAWKGTADERPAITEGLAGIRFFAEAAIVAPGGEIGAYAAALQRIGQATSEYYRQIANGREEHKVLREAIKREPLVRDLAKRFGTYVNIGKTGAHLDLHMGHTVVDRTMRIEQYGSVAGVRFVALDGIVSNGYSEWVHDGESGDGGWGTATEIYQVRPRYANGPLRDWALVSDDEARAEEEKKTAEETARDLEREKENPIRRFEGLTLRLQRQYRESVAADLREKGLDGPALRDAFLARVEEDHFTSSILRHEGRHAIDDASKKKYPVWELEYRAKLSEIALAPSAREALGSVLKIEMGGESSHGKGTEHLARGLVKWMEAHRAEIAGLDASRAMLPQIDKLTDEQIRAAVRSLDPLAK